jgi:hypothetical protein
MKARLEQQSTARTRINNAKTDTITTIVTNFSPLNKSEEESVAGDCVVGAGGDFEIENSVGIGGGEVCEADRVCRTNGTVESVGVSTSSDPKASISHGSGASKQRISRENNRSSRLIEFEKGDHLYRIDPLFHCSGRNERISTRSMLHDSKTV